MLRYNRVILSDNSVLSDLSVKLSDYLSGTERMSIVAAQDAIYLGSDMPFNHRWIEVSTPNALASAISVSLWTGSTWEPAVDVIDETAVSGVTLAQSGYISWQPNRRKSAWARAFFSEDVPALSTLKIYDLYWAKLTFSADLQSADRLYVSTTGTNVNLSDLGTGITLTHPVTHYDVLANYSLLQIAAATTLTTAIQGGSLTWKRQTTGSVQTAGSYDPTALVTYPYIKYIGHKFNSDLDLFSEYRDLSDSDQLEAYASGKTDWSDQEFRAAEYIIQDLREMGVIFSKNQILDWNQFKLASVHKVASIIYGAFGSAYKDQVATAEHQYSKYLKLKAYNVDLTQDGDLQEGEKLKGNAYFTR